MVVLVASRVGRRNGEVVAGPESPHGNSVEPDSPKWLLQSLVWAGMTDESSGWVAVDTPQSGSHRPPERAAPECHGRCQQQYMGSARAREGQMRVSTSPIRKMTTRYPPRARKDEREEVDVWR